MDSPKGQPQTIQQMVRVMQIICGSLALGATMFAVVAFTIADPKADPTPELSIIAYAFAAISLIVSPIAGRVIRNNAVASESPFGKGSGMALATAYQTGLIVSCAMLEGAAFLNIVVYQINGSAVGNLAVAGFLIVVLLSQFPTTGRVTDWITQTERRLREEADLHR